MICLPSRVNREPSSESRMNVYSPSLGTINIAVKTKPKKSGRLEAPMSIRGGLTLAIVSGLSSSKFGSWSQVSR